MRVNKNLLRFTSLALFLGLGLIIVLSKFLPLFFQKSVYFCQQFIRSFSIKIPNQIGLIIPATILLIAIGLSYKLFSTYLEVRNLRKNLILYKKTRHGLTKLLRKLNLQNVVYVIKSEKPFAFCLGIRHQKIYISTTLISLMNKKEIEAILLHEKHHLKNNDGFIMLFASSLELVFPFFPLLSDLLRQYKINREIDADLAAIQELKDTKSIISVLKKFISSPSASFEGVVAIADYETLEPRINALIKKKKHVVKFKIQNIIISLISVLIFSSIAIAPVQATQMHMDNENSTMLCLQGDECAMWCKEHNTVIPNSSKNQNASYMEPINK